MSMRPKPPRKVSGEIRPSGEDSDKPVQAANYPPAEAVDSETDAPENFPPLVNVRIDVPEGHVVTHGPELSAPMLLDDSEPQDATSQWSHEQEGAGWRAVDDDFAPVEAPAIPLENPTPTTPKMPRPRAAQFGMSGESSRSAAELEELLKNQIDADYADVEPPEEVEPASPPPAFEMPLPSALRSPATERPAAIPKAKHDIIPDPHGYDDEEPTGKYERPVKVSDAEDTQKFTRDEIDKAIRKQERKIPVPARVVPPAAAKASSMPSTGGWKQRALVGFAALAGLFGVKIGFEKAEEVAKEGIEAASDAFDHYSGKTEARMAAASPALFDQQPSEPPDTEDEEEPLTHTYTVQSGDSPWGLADSIIEASGIEDPDGTLTLKAVKGLREKNNIQGDAARSKSMWVGQTLDLSPVYDLVASVKGEKNTEETPGVSTKAASSLERKGTSAASTDTSGDTPDVAPDITTPLSAELTSHTLNYPGETVWSRTQDMLESLGMKPNMAKRGVLGAIVLADSHMSETQAMRVKHAGHKKFDATRDTLNFDRAAQAALDLKNGMSPGDVARKYGVKNQYEKLRDR